MLNHHNHRTEEVVAAMIAIRDIVRAHAIMAKLRHNHHDAKVGVAALRSGCRGAASGLIAISHDLSALWEVKKTE